MKESIEQRIRTYKVEQIQNTMSISRTEALKICLELRGVLQ